KDEKHGCVRYNRAESDKARGFIEVMEFESYCKRLSSFGCEQLVRDHAGYNTGYNDVEDRAYDERAEDSDRHIPPRILRLFCHGGDGIKTDIGEKYDCSAGGD